MSSMQGRINTPKNYIYIRRDILFVVYESDLYMYLLNENVKELEAVLRGLQHIKDMLEPGTAFQVMSDSIHVVHSLREVSEKKNWKAAYVSRWKEIRELEKQYDLRINYLFCPGEANSADGLSRPELAQHTAENKARLDWQKRNVKGNEHYL
eukprot:GHVR01149136.1.p1 GENE.GHVR01149136.1~~GHVR01149136.1.p1  ORF type:complete len:152 (-),score=6.65 GHVR01149136.1:56-511(-)